MADAIKCDRCNKYIEYPNIYYQITWSLSGITIGITSTSDDFHYKPREICEPCYKEFIIFWENYIK